MQSCYVTKIQRKEGGYTTVADLLNNKEIIMCDFISWIEYKEDSYFITNSDLNTKQGKKLLDSNYIADLKGHGAIRHYYPELENKGREKECINFRTPDNFPKEIAKALVNGNLSRIGTTIDILNDKGKAEYNKITKPALAEYEKIEQPAWVEYEKIEQPAMAAYKKIIQPAWAEYKKIEQPAMAAYKKIIQPAWAEYEKIIQSAWVEYKKIKQSAMAAYKKIIQPAWAAYEKIIQPALAEYEKIKQSA